MTDLYKVERITGKRINERGALEYKVKWQGYPDTQSTWEPLRNLRNVNEMVVEFERRNSHKMKAGLRGKTPVKGNRDKLAEHQKKSEEPSQDDKTRR